MDKKRAAAIERVNSAKGALFFSEQKAKDFVKNNGIADTHEVVQQNRAFHVKAKEQASPVVQEATKQPIQSEHEQKSADKQVDAPRIANWESMTSDQRRRARLEQEIATGKANNGPVIVNLRPSAIKKRQQELADMGERGKLEMVTVGDKPAKNEQPNTVAATEPKTVSIPQDIDEALTRYARVS